MGLFVKERIFWKFCPVSLKGLINYIRSLNFHKISSEFRAKETIKALEIGFKLCKNSSKRIIHPCSRSLMTSDWKLEKNVQSEGLKTKFQINYWNLTFKSVQTSFSWFKSTWKAWLSMKLTIFFKISQLFIVFSIFQQNSTFHTTII